MTRLLEEFKSLETLTWHVFSMKEAVKNKKNIEGEGVLRMIHQCFAAIFGAEIQ